MVVTFMGARGRKLCKCMASLYKHMGNTLGVITLILRRKSKISAIKYPILHAHIKIVSPDAPKTSMNYFFKPGSSKVEKYLVLAIICLRACRYNKEYGNGRQRYVARKWSSVIEAHNLS